MVAINSAVPKWCPEHAAQLVRVKDSFHKRGGTKRAPKPPAPEPKQEKLPLEVRMRRVVEHVAAADGPVPRAEAARAAGLESPNGSLGNILKRAKAEGLIVSRYGVGFLPGPNAPKPTKRQPCPTRA